jgi:hypothetical protein
MIKGITLPKAGVCVREKKNLFSSLEGVDDQKRHHDAESWCVCERTWQASFRGKNTTTNRRPVLYPARDCEQLPRVKKRQTHIKKKIPVSTEKRPCAVPCTSLGTAL